MGFNESNSNIYYILNIYGETFNYIFESVKSRTNQMSSINRFCKLRACLNGR